MVAPPAEAIEQAVGLLPGISQFIRERQFKELHVAMGDTSTDFQRGYELGLQVARVALSSSAALIVAGVSPQGIL